MKQYWARHEGRIRWGVRTPLVTSDDAAAQGGGLLFVWADRLVIEQGGIVFERDDGTIQGAIAPGQWEAVFEAAPDDSPQPVETQRCGVACGDSFERAGRIREASS
jgi:hypothetical protein